jgi:hypothetical protein
MNVRNVIAFWQNPVISDDGIFVAKASVRSFRWQVLQVSNYEKISCY